MGDQVKAVAEALTKLEEEDGIAKSLKERQQAEEDNAATADGESPAGGAGGGTSAPEPPPPRISPILDNSGRESPPPDWPTNAQIQQRLSNIKLTMLGDSERQPEEDRSQVVALPEILR